MMSDLGVRLATARVASQMTMQVLASKAGLHRNTIWKIESGSMEPSATILRRLCLALRISADHLLDLPRRRR
jgi:transcriptional regulator with XRE-family HTH domain